MSDEDGGTRIEIGGLFGYTHFERRPTLVAMAGEPHAPRLEIGMIVQLEADSAGYIAHFRDGDHVAIVGFQMPHTGGCTDYIVFASDGSRVAEVKPSRIARIVSPAPRALRA